MPENPLASTLARSAIDARTARTGSGASTPAAWLRSRFNCSAREVGLVDARLGEIAEAGVDAVDRRVAGGLRIDHGARRGDARPRVRREADRSPRVVGNREQVDERRDAIAVEQDHHD